MAKKSSNVTTLNLGGSNSIVTKEQLKLIASSFTKVTALSLSECTISQPKWSLENLNNLPLTELNLSSCKQMEFQLFKGHAYGHNVSSLHQVDFLEDFPSLKILNLSNLDIWNYDFLHKLTGLVKLSLEGNRRLNLNFLEKCTAIRDLNLFDCDYTPLELTPFNMYFKEGKFINQLGHIYEGKFLNCQMNSDGTHIEPNNLEEGMNISYGTDSNNEDDDT